MAVFEDFPFGGFEGRLARPEPPLAAPLPGVLVMPDAFGISTFSIGQAGRLADLGFIALAGDPYGGGFQAANQEEIAAKFASVTGDQAVLRTNVRTNMDALAAVDGVDTQRLGAIGYCLGGTAVLELARNGYRCQAVVSFHGLLATTMPASRDSLVASILVCTGADDPYAPPHRRGGLPGGDDGCRCRLPSDRLHGHPAQLHESRLVPGVAWHRVSPAERGPILGCDARLLARAPRCAHVTSTDCERDVELPIRVRKTSHEVSRAGPLRSRVRPTPCNEPKITDRDE